MNELAGLPESQIDIASWDADAYTLETEDIGLSILFRQQNSVHKWFEQIDKHIFAGIRQTVSGTFGSKLLRGAETFMPMLSPASDLVEPPEFTRQSWLNTVNELKVQHPLRKLEEIPCNCDGTISYTTLHMDKVDIQNLSVTGETLGSCNYDEYTWTHTGGGSLSADSGQSVLYMAPSSNPDCNSSPVISLYCNGDLVDSITITINIVEGCTGVGSSQHAYRYCEDECAVAGCCCVYYRCDGTVSLMGDGCTEWGTNPLGFCGSCYWYDGGCSNPLDTNCAAGQSFGPGGCGGAEGWTDLRTAQMISDGCCPEIYM
jgi:hypothetical protein